MSNKVFRELPSIQNLNHEDNLPRRLGTKGIILCSRIKSILPITLLINSQKIQTILKTLLNFYRDEILHQQLACQRTPTKTKTVPITFYPFLWFDRRESNLI
jgi:hypothetical protein